MEHSLHNPSLHWGYTAAPPTPQSHWAPPPQIRSNKRSISESDCEELYSEESSKEQISPGEPGSCQLLSRKKRRGVIEKKRRDRINSSLSELKRLVPSAYEKQGSAKLEKAEILQLTVEHLKSLHSKGIDTLSYDPQRFAMDYHIIGFRECAAEVARYLVTIEGMDIQDPLRLRLMSHLQYFVQQRELSAKSCASPGSWSATSATGLPYQPNCSASPYHSYASQATHAVPHSSTYVPNLSTPTHGYHPALTTPPSSGTMHQQQQQQQQQATPVHVSRPSSSAVTASSDSMTMLSHTPSRQQQQQQSQQAQTTQQIQAQAQGIPPQQQTQTHGTHESLHQQQQQQQQQQQHYAQEQPHSHNQEHQAATYIELTSSQDHNSPHRNSALASANALSYGGSAEYPVGSTQAYSPNGGLNYVAANGSKPYRPWGAEMAY